ncbi:MAG: P22 phage major capsid protein family protein, partial [Gallionella sp.]
MATNTLEVITMIARESLRLLRNEMNFVANINHSYDKEWDNRGGAEIGSQLKIRIPNNYTVGSGATITTESTIDEVVVLPRATQKWVAVEFTSEELTQHIDDSGVRQRVLKPAMSNLAAAIQSDCFSMVKDVYNSVGTPGTTPAGMTWALNAGRKLDESLAPQSDRVLIMNPAAQVSMVNALSSLYNSSREVSNQYLTGRMKNALGFDWYSNPQIPVLTTGSDHGTVTINGANQTGSTLVIAGANLKYGDSFTIADVYAVHPKTKTAYDYLQEFTVLADGTTSISISPSIITSG